MEKVIRWGIIGCGGIAPKFIAGIRCLENTEVVAVASKSLDKAKSLADQEGIKLYFDNYETMVSHPEVDVVYVATSHNFHKENMMLCLKHKKPVLCEKAFTVNAKEALEVIDFARKQGVFLMEAMWTRFLPCNVLLKKMLAEGVIGDVYHLQADFGSYAPFNADGRMYNINLAGGALLDLGIYPVSFAYYIFGKEPVDITSLATIGPTGVDHQNAIIFAYNNGEMAIMSSSFMVQTTHLAVITGTKGSITIPKFYMADRLILKLNNQEPEEIVVPFDSTGYNYEAQEVINCLRAGKLESAVMLLNETLQIMNSLDAVRKNWKMRYPADLE